jgi:hypothetical protein
MSESVQFVGLTMLGFMGWGYHRWTSTQSGVLRILSGCDEPIGERTIQDEMRRRFKISVSLVALRNAIDQLQVGECLSYRRRAQNPFEAIQDDQRLYSITPAGLRRIRASATHPAPKHTRQTNASTGDDV